MIQIIPGETPNHKLHQLLLGSIAPRPICLASTVDSDGRPNLSPFSFFNVFGVNPTTLIFSPARRGRDNTTKDTYENVKKVPEVVINVVTYDMVNQVSLASTEYPAGTDEFDKAALTKVPSVRIRPFRVKESPVQLECKVRDVIPTGEGPGAGNLVICEILLMHINDEVMSQDGLIDQNKISLVGRLGRDYYVRAFGEALFEVEKPIQKRGMGIDQLPEHVRLSKILSGNELGILGNIESLPDVYLVHHFMETEVYRDAIEYSQGNPEMIHKYAKKLIGQGNATDALMLLLSISNV